MKILVSYDISSDQSRRKIAAILLRYGTRVQESLFFCVLGETDFKNLKDELQKNAEKSASVLLFIMSERINVQVLSGTKRLIEPQKIVFF